MKYNFDERHDRQQTASKKWDGMRAHFNTDKELIPMWVADMDFKSPAPVIEALTARVEQGMYGYTLRTDAYLEAITSWFKRRHDWSIQKEWISHSPGIIPALSLIVHFFTEKDDKVVIQSPVHHAFYRVLRLQGRKVVENPLRLADGRYTMDLEDLEEKFIEGAKLFILCSPHNPVGRVWTEEELTRLGQLCKKYNVLVISDEVYSDVVYKPNKHIPYASISQDFADQSITCVAPSKTFNLMGLKTSVIITPNVEIRQQFKSAVQAFSLGAPGYFGITALENAYNHGEEWLEQLHDYLEGNIQFITEFLQKNIPDVQLIQPEGTYLAWLDFKKLGINDETLKEIMIEDAAVGFDEGPVFGTGGEGFMRMNFACPRSMLEEGMKNIHHALKTRTQRAEVFKV